MYESHMLITDTRTALIPVVPKRGHFGGHWDEGAASAKLE